MSDPEVLEYAAAAGRVLVSHDHRTMIEHFRARLAAGQTSPGLLLPAQGASLGEVVDAVVLIWATADPRDLRDQVHYLPSMGRHQY